MWGKVSMFMSFCSFLLVGFTLHTSSVAAQAAVIDTYVPVGAVEVFAGVTLPDGWLLADGACLDEVTYDALFAVLGDTWGSCDFGDGFLLPDLRGRVVVGSGNGVCCVNRVLGATGGFEAFTLEIANMPSHDHTINDPGHVHRIPKESVTVNAGVNVAQPAARNDNPAAPHITSGSATTGITINETGGDEPFSLMQPFAVLNYMVWSGSEELESLIDVTVVITFPTHTPTGTPRPTGTPLPVNASVMADGARSMVQNYSLWGMIFTGCLLGVVALLVRRFRRASSS